jgi:hypothetical protein
LLAFGQELGLERQFHALVIVGRFRQSIGGAAIPRHA